MLLRNIMIGAGIGIVAGLINIWLAVGLCALIFVALCVLTVTERGPLPRLHIATPRRRSGNRSGR